MTTPVESSDFTFPAADIGGELNPEASREFQVDPVSSEIAASKVFLSFFKKSPHIILFDKILSLYIDDQRLS